MLTDVVADEILRYLYFASLRPLATLAAFAALVAVLVVLGALGAFAWEGQRSRAGRARRVPSRLGALGVVILLAGASSLLW